MTSEQPATAATRRQRSNAICTTLAALVYLGFALAALAPALTAPRRLLPYFAAMQSAPDARRLVQLDHRDQQMVVSVVVRNAAILTTRPWRIFGDGQCYPTPRGYTLGEHMFGLGLLAAVPWALTHDPILTYNLALVLTLWLPALAMYALSLHFTRSPLAAFVAGLLMELLPKRLADPSHPYIHGDLWAPLALLFLHRLLTRGGARNALGFALFTSLVLCESLYPLIGFAMLLCVYGPYALIRHRERLRALWPLLALCAAWILVVACLVFEPYLETRATWGLLSGRSTALLRSRFYLPGRMGFPGFVTLALLLVAVLDRVRRPRRVAGEDPRLAFLGGAALIMSLTIGVWSLPGTGLRFPSPLALAQLFLPGLDAVRGLPSIAIAAGMPLAFVAGYGVLALIERRRPLVACAIVATLVVAVVAGRFVPALAKPAFGVRSFAVATFDARPPDDDIALARHGEGALLDVPFSWEGTKKLGMSDDLLLASYNPRPTAACYNSFASPVQQQIGELAAALPGAAAADALVALGFDTVLVEKAQLLEPERIRLFDEIEAQQSASPRLSLSGETERRATYQLWSPAKVATDFALLARGASVSADGSAATEPLDLPAGGGPVAFRFTNGGDEIFRHPDPLVPSDLVVRWGDASGALLHQQQLRALLPIALAAGASSKVAVELPAPPAPGTYAVTLARAADPETILARQTVRVAEATLPSR